MSYYAEYSEYGIDTISSGDFLAKFDTKRERDEWVERMDSREDYGEKHWQAVTTREVAHRYEFSMFENDPFGDYCHELNGERTCCDKHIHYIYHKPSYEF